jgi:hypothetical protein
MSPLCDRILRCTVLAGLRCQAVTIHGIRKEGMLADPLELFHRVLDKVQHATLVIPPTVFYMDSEPGFFNGRPEDLVERTKALESIRLIVGYTPGDMMYPMANYRSELAAIEDVQKFLASFINLNSTKFEIFIFNNFDDTLDLATFRERLEREVEELYQSSIKQWTESNSTELMPQRKIWSAKYQIFGLEDYFAIPGFHRELVSWWVDEWVDELEDRREREDDRKRKAEDGIQEVSGNADSRD